MEEDPGNAFEHRFRHSSAAERHDRFSTGLRFDRHDTEVLLAGKDQAAAAAVQVADPLVRQPAEELDVRARLFAQRPELRARADNLEWVAEPGVRANGQVEPLVRYERGHDQIEAFVTRRARREEVGVHRRIHDFRVAVVEFLDALLHVAAERDELVHAARRSPVPAAQAREHRRDDRLLQRVRPEVLLVKRPRVTHRCEAIAEVLRARPRPQSLGNAMARADQNIRRRRQSHPSAATPKPIAARQSVPGSGTVVRLSMAK